MTDIIVRSSSNGLAINNGPSVLGEQQARIPVGGKVRPGIKVLTSAALQNPKAKPIYEAGVAAGHKWDAIEKKLMAECAFPKPPLTPRNVRYFSVFRDDFTNPANAAQLLDLYGEDLDGVRRLLRFPVIFPTDSWQANLPHALQAWTSSQLLYWSDYDQQGQRRCFTRKTAEKNPQNRRAPRNFGGRPTILRPDSQGVCNPDVCPQYQGGICNLKGSLLFFIPGILGSGAISLPLTSFYGMEQARKTMAMVAFLRGGRISGTHDGRPIFYITKTYQEIAMLDRETGQPKKASHWIVTLEADIDMLQMFQAAEKSLLLASAAADAALALSAPGRHDEDHDEEPPITGEVIDQPEQNPLEAIKSARADVFDLCTEVGVEAGAFSAWMTAKTGNPNWSRELAGLVTAMTELEQALQIGPDIWKSNNALDVPF